MKIGDFFDFGSKLVQTTFTASPVNVDGEDVDGDIILSLAKGQYNKMTFPIVCKQSDGKVLRDLLDTGWATLYLISEKMRGLLEANHFTGWKVFPIEIFDKKGNPIEGYWGFSITGKCGNIDYTKCEIVQKRYVPTGPLVDQYRGLEIGLDEWDGSDIFCPYDTYHIIVSKRVAQAIKKAKLSNIELRNLADVEVSVFSIKILEKHRGK